MTVPLPVPDDPALVELLLSYPEYERRYYTPRSAWLHDVEAILRAGDVFAYARQSGFIK